MKKLKKKRLGHSPQLSKKTGKHRCVSKNTVTTSRSINNRQQKDLKK